MYRRPTWVHQKKIYEKNLLQIIYDKVNEIIIAQKQRINDMKKQNEEWKIDRSKVNENTNNNNGNRVEEVVLENKIANNDYNDESVVVIESGTLINDGGCSNDDTFTSNSASLSAVEIKTR